VTTRRGWVRVWLSVLGLVLLASPAAGQMVYRYHRPESDDDRRYDYHWELLRLVLEKTTPAYGPYILTPSPLRMNEARQLLALKDGLLTVILRDAGPQFESRFLPVRIPLDKGVLGYRIFLIRRDRQAEFSRITTLDQLRAMTVGQGLGWTDVQIWRSNGFQVVEGSSYDGLFRMTIGRRFDFFSRGLVEIVDEYARRSTTMPDLAIEQTLCVYFPLPWYFYFARTEEGRRLAARVERGLRMMIADGSFDRVFLKYHADVLRRQNLAGRRIFRLTNPLLTPETPLADKALWYVPPRTPAPTAR
jgi:hypothetical protein